MSMLYCLQRYYISMDCSYVKTKLHRHTTLDFTLLSRMSNNGSDAGCPLEGTTEIGFYCCCLHSRDGRSIQTQYSRNSACSCLKNTQLHPTLPMCYKLLKCSAVKTMSFKQLQKYQQKKSTKDMSKNVFKR